MEDIKVVENLYILVQPSYAEATLMRANSLLLLAESCTTNSATLCACAVVMLATALEQSTMSAVEGHVTYLALDQSIERHDVESYYLLGSSLRKRIMELPQVLTNGKFQINRRSPLCRDLNDLISLRNQLVHITETTLVSTNGDPNVEISADSFSVPMNFPPDIWASVHLVQARSFSQSVETYFDEIIRPNQRDMKPGKLIMK